MDIEDILSGLNPGQREAVSAVDGAYLVVAGAGSGKTTVLSRRVAALIKIGIDPSSILLLTFTRAAAKNMIERAKKLSPGAVDVVGGTFHSIAHKLVVENHNLFRLPEKPTILDPEDVKSAFRKIAAEIGGKDENLPKASLIAKAHSYAINTKRELDDVVWDRHPQFSYAIDFIVQCSRRYREYKAERGLLDYDDLLVAWDKMMDHPQVGEAVRQSFRYVLVDEHQDSNAIQCSIIEKLGGHKPNVMAVGDPAQAIYAFRGSAPRTMFAFRECWPDCRIINLDTNYRSGEDILGVANAIDRSMHERFDRELRPAPGAYGETPALVTVPTLDDEAVYVAERILENKADGIDLSDQAVLVRSMSAARHIEAEFVRRRIPYKVSGGIRISDAAHIKDILCLARTVVNILDEPAWTRVLTMAKGVGDKKAEAVYREISKTFSVEGMFDPSDRILEMCRKSPDIGRITEARRILGAGGPPLEAIHNAVAALDELFGFRYEDWKSRKTDIEAVAGLAEGHDTLDSFLSNVVLDHSVDKKANVQPSEDEERPVTLSTVHSAKGLEWDVVFIPSFVDGHMPSVFAKEPEEFEEEKRILYVAFTRPRKSLHVVKPVIGRQNALAASSPFEALFSDMVLKKQVGERRSPKSFMLNVSAEIDFR